MGVPVIKLNLVPALSPWRRHHVALGRGILLLGILCLLGVIALVWRADLQAQRAGRQAITLVNQTRDLSRREDQLVSELQEINVEQEAPRWKLAERILSERSIPWTRITAELERSLAQDVRLKSIQRGKAEGRSVEIKIKGEAKTREAEVVFMESLRRNAFFAQVILEREAERSGGGVDFDYTLTAAERPPAYTPLPLYGPTKKNAPGRRP